MSEVTTNQSVGYFDGVLDLYVAIVKTAGTAAAAPVYDTPEIMGHSMEVTITPVYKEGKVYASNALQRQRKVVDAYDVKCKVDQVMPGILQKILARKVDANGVQIISDQNDPPEVAIGFALTLDDGTQELWWIYRGKFAETELSAKTQEDKFEYQHPTVSARFERRIHDRALAAIVATNTAQGAQLQKNWFTSVYEPSEAAATQS